MSAASERIRLKPGAHAVHFYEAPAELAELVVEHVAGALDEGAVMVAIATKEHIRAFEHGLDALGVDLEEARASMRLVFLDARDTLASLRVDGQISREAFQRVIRVTIRDAGERGGPVRAYGEMVDLLWQEGRINDAIELEVLWNELIEECEFSLLCAYHSEVVGAPGHERALGELCRLHTSVSNSPTPGGRPGRNASQDFEPGLDAPHLARRFVEEALRRWGQDDTRLDDARLLLSELVTNAVIHARSPFSVSIGSDGGRVRLAVRDRSPAHPILRPGAPDAVSGRGLQIVAALARDWGILATPIGKTIWAEL